MTYPSDILLKMDMFNKQEHTLTGHANIERTIGYKHMIETGIFHNIFGKLVTSCRHKIGWHNTKKRRETHMFHVFSGPGLGNHYDPPHMTE